MTLHHLSESPARKAADQKFAAQLTGIRSPEHAPRRGPKDFSRDFELDAQGPEPAPREYETDGHKLDQRQKQIDFGKNTLGYARYCKEVPRYRRLPQQPSTPDKTKVCSKRAFDGLVKQWRRQLHRWDPEEEQGDVAMPIVATPAALPPPPPLPQQSSSAGPNTPIALTAQGAHPSRSQQQQQQLPPPPLVGSKRRAEDNAHQEGEAKSRRTDQPEASLRSMPPPPLQQQPSLISGARSNPAVPPQQASSKPAVPPQQASSKAAAPLQQTDEAGDAEADIFGEWEDDFIEL